MCAGRERNEVDWNDWLYPLVPLVDWIRISRANLYKITVYQFNIVEFCYENAINYIRENLMGTNPCIMANTSTVVDSDFIGSSVKHF